MQTSANDSRVAGIAKPVSAIAADAVPMTNEASSASGSVTVPEADTLRDLDMDRSPGGTVDEPALLPAPAPAPISAGQALAHARAAKGLTVEDVSRQLKLSVAQVHALESDNHVSLPSPIYVRGFLRSYAHFIGADISALLPARTVPVADATASSPTAVVQGRMMRQQAGAAVMEQRSYSRWLWAVGIIACVVAALAYYEFVLNVPTAAPTRVSGDAAKHAEQPSPAIVSAPATVQAELPQADVVPLVATSTSPPVSASPRELHFVFKSNSWVEVIDGADATLHRQRNLAGTELKLKGTPPLQLVVGAASGVRLRYDGKVVDLSSRVEGGDIARFTLE